MHDQNHTTETTDTLHSPAPDTVRGHNDPSQPGRQKTCRTCAQELPLDAFYRQRGCHESHRVDCKECTKARARTTRARRTAAERAFGDTLLCVVCRHPKPVREFQADGRCRIGFRRVCRTCRLTPPVAPPLSDLHDQPEGDLPSDSPQDERRIELGLAIAAAIYPPGSCLSCEEIAAFTGLTESAVRKIEQRALAKLHKAALGLLRSHNLDLPETSERP